MKLEAPKLKFESEVKIATKRKWFLHIDVPNLNRIQVFLLKLLGVKIYFDEEAEEKKNRLGGE